MGQLFSPHFIDLEVSLLKVCEQITAFKILHDDVNMILVFEYIEQSDDERVLAHLKDFDFSSLEFHILNCHFFLGHYFNSDVFAGLLVSS